MTGLDSMTEVMLLGGGTGAVGRHLLVNHRLGRCRSPSSTVHELFGLMQT
jgi:hypothetical protein